MRKELLNLTPSRYLCPKCGLWHYWSPSYKFNLGDYDESTVYKCPNSYDDDFCQCAFEFHVDEDYFYFKINVGCINSLDGLREVKVPISSIEEQIFSDDDCLGVLFNVKVFAKEACKNCFKNECFRTTRYWIGEKEDFHNRQKVTLPLGFEFDIHDVKSIEDEEFGNIGDTLPIEEDAEPITVKEEDIKRIEDEEFGNIGDTLPIEEEDAEPIAVKEENVKPIDTVKEKSTKREKKTKKNKEGTAMADNIFNVEFGEFGPNNDPNIASTLVGLAVKTDGNNWRIYDKTKKEITDVGNLQLGNLPIFLVPTFKLKEGDLIKSNNEYYFVNNEAPIEVISARTGEIKNAVPVKNILGFSCYCKVIAVAESLLDRKELTDTEGLVIASMMSGQTGENNDQIKQLLPLLLFKDRLNVDDDEDMMKLLLMSSMMKTTEGNDSQINQLLPLLLFKDRLNVDDDEGMMKLLLMSSMMKTTEGNDSQMNQFLPLLLFKDKKNEKSTKTYDVPFVNNEEENPR